MHRLHSAPGTEVPAQSKENIGHRACSYLYGPVDLRSVNKPCNEPCKTHHVQRSGHCSCPAS